MKNAMLILSFVSSAMIGALFAERPVVQMHVKVTNEKGIAMPEAEVIVVLKSGGHVKATFDDGAKHFIGEASDAVDRVFAAAPGFQGASVKASAKTAVVVTLIRSAERHSLVTSRGWNKLPGIEGGMIDAYSSTNKDSVMLHFNNISVIDGRRAAISPFSAEPRRKIDMATNDGKKFSLWILDATPQGAVVDYTMPK